MMNESSRIGGSNTDNSKQKSTIMSGNKSLDRLWLHHFARAIYKEGIFDEQQYKELLSMIDRELARMYKNAA